MLLYNYFFKKKSNDIKNYTIESHLELNDWISIQSGSKGTQTKLVDTTRPRRQSQNLYNKHNKHHIKNKTYLQPSVNLIKNFSNDFVNTVINSSIKSITIKNFSNDFVNTVINSSIKSITIKNFSNNFVNTVIDLTIHKIIDNHTTIIKINEMIKNPTNYFIKYILKK
jgi:hypothetical protein